MKKNELTNDDFKIGQIVTCVKFDDNDYWEQHLTVGKKYEIEDIDWHFQNSIVLRSDNKKLSQFVPIRFFSDKKIIRKMKLEKLNKICTK